MTKVNIFFLIIFPYIVLGQSNTSIDNNYLEDQFYIGFNHAILVNKTAGHKTESFSYSISLGFIKDIPISHNRNFAIGIGMGYATSSYYSNLVASLVENNLEYEFSPSNIQYKNNKFEMHSIELPIEFRWRNSTPTEYKFIRFYSGLKFSYHFNTMYIRNSVTSASKFEINSIERFEYGFMLNIGYNTFNIHFYYPFNNFFKEPQYLTNSNQINIKYIKVGIQFYIL